MILNHYDVLSFPTDLLAHRISQKEIKAAYHRALLAHHPDKATAPSYSSATKYTIDDVKTAYGVLSDPLSRSEHDRTLRLQAPSQSVPTQNLAGLEIADLDDLQHDEAKGYWYRNCRCGQDRGFIVSESDLEREVEHGEITTGCVGCSLWLSVKFQQAESE